MGGIRSGVYVSMSGEDEDLVVHREIRQRLDDHDAYPEKIFRLECEAHGVYQNQSNVKLDGLEDQGRIDTVSATIDGTDRTFLIEGGSGASPSNKVKEATKKFYELIEQQGYFGDLCVYVALCKIYDEIGEGITGMEVLPEGGRPHLLNGPGRSPDALVSFEEEHVPIEVFNGADYIGTSHDKYDQLNDYADVDGITPFLISRRCDDGLKNVITREWNGGVVHTDSIMWCESADPEASEVLDVFQLDDIICKLPKLESSTGSRLDGEEYNKVTSSQEEEDVNTIRPPDKMVDAAETLPDEYVRRIRGGIQLHYVESIWRRVNDQLTKDAAVVLQSVYRQLLWHGGMDPDTVIDDVWEDYASDRISESARRKGKVLRAVDDLYQELCDKKIIWKQSGKCYARASDDPMPWLEA